MNFRVLTLIFLIFFNFIVSKKVTLMLDPAGDAKNIGRIIDKYFERGITLQFAQAIKQKLETLDKDTRIVLTRFPGEMLEHLQNASFSNRLNADLYIRFEFYPTEKDYSDISVYYCSYNKQTDFWVNSNNNNLEFISYNKAYKINFDKTYSFSKVIDSFFKDNSQKYSISYLGSFGLPLRPLMGVIAPALLLEMGISKKEDITKIIKPISKAILELLKSFKNLNNSE